MCNKILPFSCGIFLGKSVGEFQNWLRVVFSTILTKNNPRQYGQICPRELFSSPGKKSMKLAHDHHGHDTDGVAQ